MPSIFDEVALFRNRAIKAAKDFRYGEEVVEALKNAKTIDEMDRIMKTARHAKFKD